MSHLETLAEEGKLTLLDVDVLTRQESQWPNLKDAVLTAIEKHGAEKLKPLFEETNGQFDYLQIRLVRMWHWVETRSN